MVENNTCWNYTKVTTTSQVLRESKVKGAILVKSEKMMKEAPVWKLLLTMGLPCVVIMIVNVLYNMADTFFIGQTGDALQVASVSLAGPAYSVLSCLGTLFGSGACTAIALALGKGEREKAKHYSAFATWAGVGVGVALSAVMLIFLDPLLTLLGANAETAGFAAQYLRIALLGSPFVMFNGAAGNFIRADGSTAKAMVISMAGTFLNIVLDPLFILVFDWGVTGAAIATVIGNAVSSVLVYLHVRKSDCLSVSIKDFTLRKEISLRTISLGLPMAASTVLNCFAVVFANQLMVQYGNIAVAAQNVAGKAGMLIAMIVMGVCMGIQPAISYVYGAGDKKRLRKIVTVTTATSLIISTVLCAICLLNREAFIRAFLDDPAVLELGKTMMLPLLITPVCSIYQICASYLQGIGKAVPATLVSLLRQGLVYVPMLFLTNALWGLTGLIFASSIADIVATLVALVPCFYTKKSKRIAQIPAEI